ncbi:MAG: hypothetical protein JXB15_12000 [Anaerolineales bacterium]|nr:hypothetical protein [Anaerolineales bacterium]
MRENRGSWYLLTGLIIGLALGLAYAWVIQPVEYVDTFPASLRTDFKDQYRALIASAYVANGDMVRARARLELLGDEDLLRTLSEQAQRTLAEGQSIEDARALGLLAIALGQNAPGPAIVITKIPQVPTETIAPTTSLPALPTGTKTPPSTATITRTSTSTPLVTASTTQSADEQASQTAPSSLTITAAPSQTASATPRLTDTPTLTRTPTATPGGPFVLLTSKKICDQKLPQPLITVEAVNSFGQPMTGILVIITWDSGEERFYTGLKPEKGPGYADFTAVPGIIYTLRLGEGGQPVLDLSAVECQGSGGESYWGAWQLRFAQP